MSSYVMFIENNHKEKEVAIVYIQYDGNEAALAKLQKLIDKADFSDMGGDYSTVDLASDIRFSQEAVEQHLRIKAGGYGPMFSKCDGKADFDLTDEQIEEMDAYEAAEFLDEKFGRFHICDYFLTK